MGRRPLSAAFEERGQKLDRLSGRLDAMSLRRDARMTKLQGGIDAMDARRKKKLDSMSTGLKRLLDNY